MARERKSTAGKLAGGERKPANVADNTGDTNVGAGEQINGHDSFDPATVTGEPGAGAGGDSNDSGANRRKPRSDAGRARGARKSAPLDLTDLKDIMVMAHAAIAIAFNAPTLSIDDMEGEKLAGAVQKVLRHYDLPDVASETKDWIGLIIVAGSIYGPRMAAHWATKNTPEPAPTPQHADNIVGMRLNSPMPPGA